MEPGAYRPSRYRHFLGWGAGLVVVGVGLLPVLIVFLAIGAFDQWHIKSEGQVLFYFSVPILRDGFIKAVRRAGGYSSKSGSNRV